MLVELCYSDVVTKRQSEFIPKSTTDLVELASRFLCQFRGNSGSLAFASKVKIAITVKNQFRIIATLS